MKTFKFRKTAIAALAVLVVLPFMAACGSQSPSSGESGSVSFGVQIGNSFAAKPEIAASGKKWAVDCSATGISTISATVTNSSGTTVKTGGPWTCTTGSGTISAVPVGSNYTVTLTGKNSAGTTIFSGATTGVSVTANATTSAGTVTLSGTVWTSKDSMTTARWRLGVVSPSCTTCSVGSDGEPVYAIGGFTSTTTTAVTNTVQMFSGNIWVNKTSLTTARGGVAAAAVAGSSSYGKIYVTGGWSGSNVLGTVEEYDPNADTWTTKSASMTTARDNHCSAVVSGVVYVVGGWDGFTRLSSVEAYTPSTNTWSTKASMSVARENLACATVGGKIYAIGGDSTTNLTLTTVEEYDPSTNTWTTKTSMPTSRRYLTATVAGSKIYAIGGADSSDVVSKAVEIYDPSANAWSTGVSLTNGRSGQGAATITAGTVSKIYAVGGWNGTATVAETVEFIP